MTKAARPRPHGSPRRPAPARDARNAGGFVWPTWPELANPKAPWLLCGLTLIATRLVLGYLFPFAGEDAYITFRYANSLSHGFGLVFNPGERVFGFTSPLWTIWTAAGIKLGAPPVPWTRLTTLAMELATLGIVVAMLRRHASNTAAWVFAFLFAAWPYFSAASLSGMENTAMVGIMAAAAAWCASRSPFAGPALGALALMRPEGVAAALVLAPWASWRDRLVGAAIAIAGWSALGLYFGSPIPASVLAKSQVYGTPGPWAGRHWWDWLVPFVFGRFPVVTDTSHLFLMSLVLAPSVVLGARELWSRRRSPLAAFVAACLAVWLGYAVLGVAFFWWYLVVPLAGFVTLAAIGFPHLARGRALYVSSATLIVGLWTVAIPLYGGRSQSEYLSFGRVATYLQTHATPGQKVMLEPIGMIGYQAPLVVVDEVGLVSPEVATRRTQGSGWYADVAQRERPDWLVVRRGQLAGGRAFAGVGAPFRDPAERDALLARYELVAAVDSSAGDNTLWVLRRRP